MPQPIEAHPSKSTKKNSHLGRRHRRALWSVGLLAVAGLAGSAVGLGIYRARQPEIYKPGEDLTDITHNLDRDAAPESRTPAASSDSHSPSDSLQNLDRPLPAGAPQPRFSDVTRQSGLAAFRSFAGNRSSQLPEDMGSGVAWGDFDNDGNEDLFIVSAGGSLDLPPEQRAPSLLFHNLGNGTFQKIDNFPDTRIIGMGAAWGDYDNDGWLDLVVTGRISQRLVETLRWVGEDFDHRIAVLQHPLNVFAHGRFVIHHKDPAHTRASWTNQWYGCSLVKREGGNSSVKRAPPASLGSYFNVAS